VKKDPNPIEVKLETKELYLAKDYSKYRRNDLDLKLEKPSENLLKKDD